MILSSTGIDEKKLLATNFDKAREEIAVTLLSNSGAAYMWYLIAFEMHFHF